jgi:hypothetical protein
MRQDKVILDTYVTYTKVEYETPEGVSNQVPLLVTAPWDI